MTDLLFAVLGRAEAPPLSSLDAKGWAALQDAACDHGVAPLLHHRLRERGVTDVVPTDVTRRLVDLHSLATLRAEARTRQLGEALAALRSHDIPVVLLKGAYLAEHAYPSPALRPMGDLDLLVPRVQLDAATAALVGVGYAEPDEQTRDAYRHHRHPPPLRRRGHLPIELHTAIEPCAPPFHLPLADVWTRARPAPTAGEHALALAPEDLLLHLATHMGRSHLLGASLVSVLDVLAWMDRFGAMADWDSVVRRAMDSGARRFVYAALGLARAALMSPVPPEVLQALRVEADDTAIANALGVLRWPRRFPAGVLALHDPRREPWAVVRRLGRALVVDPLQHRHRSSAAVRPDGWRAALAPWVAVVRFLLGPESRRLHRRQAARVRALRQWALDDAEASARHARSGSAA